MNRGINLTGKVGLALGVILLLTGGIGSAQEEETNSAVFQETALESAPQPPLENPAPRLSEAGDEGIRLNFRGAHLDDILDYLSMAAGFIIIREVEIEGRVDVWSHQPVNKDEAVDLLNTILHQKGYTAIRNDRILNIVRREDARMRDIPVRTGANPEHIDKSHEMVTQIIPVRYANAPQLAQDLSPLIPSYATLTANQSSNALVLTDTQTNIRRMVEIIQALDTSIASISMLRVFPLQYSDAKELADVINKVFENQQTGATTRDGQASRVERFFARMSGEGGPPPGAGDSIARQTAARVMAVADERTNSLVVSAPVELMMNIAELVQQIDTVTEDITTVRVFHLRYANAEEMVNIIKTVFEEDTQSTQAQTQRRRFVPGRPPVPVPDDSQQSGRRTLQESKVQAVADTRTNSVIVSAARTTMEQIEQMIIQLDENPAKEKKVFVYSLENADVDSVADILRGMFEESSTQRRSTDTGSDRLRQSIGTQGTTTGTGAGSRR